MKKMLVDSTVTASARALVISAKALSKSSGQARVVGRRLVSLVFHRRGKPIVSFTKAWRAACKAAGVPGRLFHDLRRTAVRDYELAGVPRSVAKRTTGHRSDSVYERYAIMQLDDQADALARVDAHRAARHVDSSRTVRQFQARSGQ
jgi:integrase